MRRAASILLFALCAALVLPIFSSGVSGGMLFAIPFGLLGLILALPKPVSKKLFNRYKAVRRLLTILYIILFAFIAVTSALMISKMAEKPADSGTVVVLGCQVREDGPSKMLRRRTDAAIEYLKAHPDSAVVATGGQGRNEPRPEAHAIRDYLIENGIAADRIYVDDTSKNTRENLENAAKIIKENNLADSVVIASDGFHQYRASLFASRAGLESSPLSSATPIPVLLTYWLRETLALLRVAMMGR